jgi:hypothetical protein
MAKLTNISELHDSELRLLSDALEAFGEKTDIQGKIVQVHPEVAADYRADASVTFVLDGQTHRYTVECKKYVDRKAQIDQIDQIDRSLRQLNLQFLLVTDYISKELAAYCRIVGLQFIDTHGNAYLRAPGLFVFTTGEKSEHRRQTAKAPKGLTNQAALRVIFTLLSKPELVSATFKEISVLSDVALGTAYNVLEDLERRGYLIAGSKHSRKLLEPHRLVDEWVANFPTTLRTKLNSRRFGSPDPYWWRHTDIAGFQAAWGSEVAAAKMFKHLKPSSQTLYVDPKEMSSVITKLAKQIRLRPDPDGCIEILEKFWSPAIESEPGIAPPLLVYSDLLALLDPRAKETAYMIKEKFIEPAIHPN